ncbi:MAG: HAD family phosphatase [Bacteroidales bacterium]|nr:HAD family phosphatase [Bacteroidales bacterium]
MVKGAIFDMDGVLVDNQDVHREAFVVICKKYGVPFAGGAEFERLFGMGNEEIFEALMPEVVRRVGWQVLAEEKETLYRKIFEKTIEPLRGLPSFLRALKETGFKIAVGSSGNGENVKFVLSKCGISEFFDAIVNGDMVSRCKPDPEIYLTAAAKLGLDPSECVVMEDAPAGIQAARRAGCHVVVLATSFPRSHHSDYDILIDDFTQITPAELSAL